jgi:photosystem II stability/assembly factor-like uncharacterized protein
MTRVCSVAAICALAILAAPTAPVHAEAAPPTVDPARYSALEWREIGPYRGGRVTAVTGIPGKPREYFMGAAGGGLWHTQTAGLRWQNVSDDDFNVGTIGAVAVAPSDHNVVYVGTGEAPIRGVTTSHGDGVYKSVDGGAHFEHAGLAPTRQIADILVHPRDANLVYVAAQGNPWGDSEARGVYRSSDGGATWDHVLSVNASTGATDLSMDPNNPRVLYASMWHHQRNPWFIRSGGEGGGLYKSVDGGDTWHRLEAGLPALVGKIGVAVSPSRPSRVYAIVEAEEGGLYRSDDAGESWRRLNGQRLIQARAWYYNHIAADPQDPDTVYVLNVNIFKSIDGGSTFTSVRAPHGDHHALWINPDDPANMVNGNDGGATVTFDGGSTWTTLYNQPTAQIYRVSTDNRFPFWIYGGQQDNSTVAIASQTMDGGIGQQDYHAVGGGESAHIAFDPDDPRLIYATTINATLTEYDATTERVRPIKPYPEYVFGRNLTEQKYRANWNAPVSTSPHDPTVLYYGTQKLLRSDDRGITWAEISPDLTRNDPAQQGLNGGPITNEQAGAEFYNTIFYVVESPHTAGEIWVGSDDGLVHMTRNGGADWRQVTPPGLPEAQINAIEISPHAPERVYLAVTGYKLNDFTPRLYVTDDGGSSWRRIDDGLPADTFVRVVREDPVRSGLLYAGTEAGMFVSFDAGGHWRSLDQNLPPVPVTDLAIRQDKLVAATQGRGFWVLDDLSTLRQMTDAVTTPGHLYRPADAVMVNGGSGGKGAFEGTNPDRGAVLYYHLTPPETEAAEPVSLPVELEILDATGAIVRRYSSAGLPSDGCVKANEDARRPVTIRNPPAAPGLNRWVWDFERDRLHCIDDVRLFAGWSGPAVIPGEYQVRLRYADTTAVVPLNVISDPRLPYDAAAAEEQARALDDAVALMNELLETLNRARTARSGIRNMLAQLGARDADSEPLFALAEQAVAQIDAWESTVTQPKHETFEDDINWPNMLDVQMRHLIDAIDRAGAPVTAGALQRQSDLQAIWQQRLAALRRIDEQYIAPFNAGLVALGQPHVSSP